MNIYGKRLRELREKSGHTQEELAKLLNTSRSRIGMYEQGKRQPDFEMQEALADFFNVTLDYLFGRSKEDTELYENLNPRDKEIFRLLSELSPEQRDALLVLLKNRG